MRSNGLTQTNPKPTRPILVVAEDLELRERLFDALTRYGHVVMTVHSGERAMAVLKHDRPGVILVDTALTDMTCWALAERIQVVDAHLPVIFLGDPPKLSPGARLTQTTSSTLPRSVSEDLLLMEIDRRLSAPQPAPHERWPGTVLVVDDEPKLRRTLREFLELHGFTVVTACSGEDALRCVEHAPPTAVLLDIKMPGMDGLLTLKKLKALQPAAAVIMMTSLEEEPLIGQAFALGASDYFLKPFDLEGLETTLLSRILLGRTP
ncbi:MAG: response regulator [Candidatus Rokubacteria bacterium]|nr:response regulator [Candidatus Rokubacteria bacterium]